MAIIRLRGAAALLPLVSQAAAWTATNYLITSQSLQIGQSTTRTITTTVTPTGSVSPISTNTSLTTYGRTNLFDLVPLGSYVVTVTDMYLGPNASACSTGEVFKETCFPPTTTASTGKPAITTRYFAPIVISAPGSCTKTSFSYTSSVSVNPEVLPSGIGLQATASSEAAFVTTYVSTLSTDLGGQPVTTTYADVYLTSGAVISVTPGPAEASLLSECVDPASYLCSSSEVVTNGPVCTHDPITYPPTGPSPGSAGATTTGGSPKNGVEGRAGLVDRMVLLVIVGVAAACLL